MAAVARHAFGRCPTAAGGAVGRGLCAGVRCRTPVAVSGQSGRVAAPSTLGVWHASELAHAVGASCSTLERSFELIYETTPRRYSALVRLRHTMEALRNDDGSLEGVILGAGWRRVKDAHRSIRKSTGMTLSGVRKLRDAE